MGFPVLAFRMNFAKQGRFAANKTALRWRFQLPLAGKAEVRALLAATLAEAGEKDVQEKAVEAQEGFFHPGSRSSIR